MNSYYLTSCSLLGDLLLQTPAIRALRVHDPEAWITYLHGTEKNSGVLLHHNPDLDCLNCWPQEQIEAFLADLGPQDKLVRMDCTAAYTWGQENNRTLAEGFGPQLGVDVQDLRYRYVVTPDEARKGKELVQQLGQGKPVVFVARHSASCSSNDPHVRHPNKCVSNEVWVKVAKWLQREGFVPIAVGAEHEAQDSRYREWPGERLYGQPLRTLAGALQASHAVLTVDTGIRHLASAVQANMYCISGCIPLSLIRCEPTGEGQKIYEEQRLPHHVTASLLVEGARKIL